ncbi:MAG TPA: tetratricopeptide repeat protein [Bryobacteraceae bacterium]|jgi:tetratricopeptide (TPR) repeat protein|nr:tetratricopeptide repeat protein [Bryobacteraceae bacterium]
MATKRREIRAHHAPAPAAVAQAQPRASWGWYAAIGAAATLVAFLVYGPALHGPFLFDDSFLPFALSGDDPLGNWLHSTRPLLMLTYWLNVHLSGEDTFSYHVVNVLLHCAASGMMFLVVRRLLEWSGQEKARLNLLAGFAAAVFLLHPVQSEVVAYLAGRSEALSVFLFLAAYALFLYRPNKVASWGNVAAVLAVFAASLLAKEHTIVLPALLLLTDYWWNPGFSFEGIRRNWRLYLPMAAGALAGLIYFLPIIRYSSSVGFRLKDLTWYQYFFTQCRALFVYLWLFAFPSHQSADWGFPMSRNILDRGALIGLLALVALAGLAWYYRRKYRLASFGFFAFLLLMAPTSSIFPIRDAITERRLYLSMLGLLLITLDLVPRLKLERRKLAAACAVLVLILAGLTYARAQAWSSELTLWEDTIQKSPDNPRAHFQLASAYYNLGRCAEAVGEYQKTAQLETPDYNLLVNWALAYDCQGQSDNALARLQQAAALEPKAHAYSQIGMIYGKLAKWPEAMEALAKAEQLDPSFAVTYVYKGLVHMATNQPAAAMQDFQRALALDPKLQQARDGLAQAQARLQAGH